MFSISIYVPSTTARESLVKIIKCYFSARDTQYRIKQYDTLSDLQKSKEYSDVLFLDIDSDTQSVIRTAYNLRKKNPALYLIVISDKYLNLDDAMDMNAFRYFGKNTDIRRVFSALNIIAAQKDEVTFMSNYINVRLPLSDIVCIYSRDRKTTVLTASGSKYITTVTIKEWLNKLSENNKFIHPHYSYIVNKNFITEFDGAMLTIQCRNGNTMEIFPAQRKLTETKTILFTKMNAEDYE